MDTPQTETLASLRADRERELETIRSLEAQRQRCVAMIEKLDEKIEKAKSDPFAHIVEGQPFVVVLPRQPGGSYVPDKLVAFEIDSQWYLHLVGDGGYERRMREGFYIPGADMGYLSLRDDWYSIRNAAMHWYATLAPIIERGGAKK